MAQRRKFYVVWEGRNPGIYDSWEEAKDQIDGFPGAQYKSYTDQTAATEAFRRYGEDPMAFFRAMKEHKTSQIVNYEAFPEIDLTAIAVDAACAGNPGPMEYRGVRVATGEQLFRVGPLQDATNNIGEYLAIIHAAAMLKKLGDTKTKIYTDSRTALAWIRAGHARSKIVATPANAYARQLLSRADTWLAHNSIANPIEKWNTELWGEIPADFGRK